MSAFQINAIEREYDRLQMQYLSSREKSANQIEAFKETQAAPMLTAFNDQLKALRADVSHKHAVCISGLVFHKSIQSKATLKL